MRASLARRFRGWVRSLPMLVLVAGIACGGRDGAPGAQPDSGTALPAGFVPSGLTPRAGQCEDAGDCGPDGAFQCIELPVGYRVCVRLFEQATASSSNPTGDECDAARPCASGTCFESVVYPSGQCGLGGASTQNVCREDACSSDADCPNGVCGPPGLTSDASVEGGAVRQCLRADCRSSADCSQSAGGVCSLIGASCERGTSLAATFRPARLACVYADGCASSADCPRGVCTVRGGSAVCIDGALID